MNGEKNHLKKYIAIFMGVLLFAMTIGMGIRTSASAAVSGTITASTLFMRTGPSTEYPKVEVNGKTVFLSRGDSVAISYGSNGWYYVTASFEGTKVNGFVSAAYILAAGTVPTAAPTATPKATSTPKPTSKPASTPAASANEVVTSGFPRKGSITAGTLNVRNNAGTTGTTIIGKLSKGESVELLDATKVNSTYWYKISYIQNGEEKTGYVSSLYVKPVAVTATPKPTKAPTSTPSAGSSAGNEVLTEGFPRTGTITAEGLSIRSGAGTSYSRITVLEKGSEVVIESAEKDSAGTYWYKVSCYQEGELVEGYASSKYIAVAAPTAAPTPTNTPAPTHTPTPSIDSTENVVNGTFPRTGTVIASSLNVRKGAGTSYEAVASVIKTTKVLVLSAKEASNGDYWYQISFTRDGVKQTGYVHSKYIEVDTMIVTATPVPTKTPAASTTPTVTPTPTAVPTQGVETTEITKEEITDELAFFYYKGKTAKDETILVADMNASAEPLVKLAKEAQVMIINQYVEEDTIWYRIAVKSDNKVVYGYALSADIILEASRDNAVAAQITEDKIRIRNSASSKGSYIKTSEGKILTLSMGDIVWIIAEEAEQWFKIVIEKDDEVYEGYVQEGPVYLMEAGGSVPATPTPTPTATPIPTESPTTTPTVTPRPVTSTPTVTPGVTNTPVPVEPPSPTLQVLPTPAVIQMEDDNYPANMPGTVTGYGKLYNEYGNAMVVYVQPTFPYDIVCDENGNYIIFQGEENIILYDKYRKLNGNLYRHIGFEYNGKMYYGYVNDTWVAPSENTEVVVPPTSIPDVVYPSGSTEPINPWASVDFETYIDQQGFPENYKTYLRALHMQYPNWIFEADHTGLDWTTVIDEETISGKNLIPNSKHIGWKSLATGAYDWTKDKFVVYDGSTWVTASRAAVEYYMDPRNFLNASNIFMFEVLRYAPDYQDEEGVESILYNTPFYRTSYTYTDEYGNSSTLTYAQTFIAAAEYSGVSPYHLASRVKQEVVTSSTTASNSVSGTVSGYTGLYNFYNIGAYHSTVAGGAIINGLKYAKNGASNNDELNDASLIPWTNPYNAIVGGAYILGANYINRGQDTIYLQKFNVTENSTYYHQYMANVEAPYSESKKTSGAYEDVGSLPIVFSIPVYENMPQEPVAEPEIMLNPNNWLKTLEVFDENGEELQLTPTFNLKTDQVYYMVVESAVGMVQIEAEPVSKKTDVRGTGFHGLEYGTNVLSITTEAENGDTREYLLVIIRQE